MAVNSAPPITYLLAARNCSTCHHFDGEHWCALMLKDKLISGYIVHPALVVCVKHVEEDSGHLEAHS